MRDAGAQGVQLSVKPFDDRSFERVSALGAEQRVLETVRLRFDALGAHHARGALERVRAAKHQIERGAVAWVAFQTQQTVVENLQMFLGFGAKATGVRDRESLLVWRILRCVL